jgi:hypothetical protein
LGFSLFSCKEKTKDLKNYEKRPCIILSVKHYGVGERNTLQVDPQWIATTECGDFTLRTPVEEQDTLWIYYPKGKK